MDTKGDEDDLGEYMEVVTMYRCKFCVYTASGSKEMAQHVKSTHVMKPQVTENTPATVNLLQTSHPVVDIVKAESGNILAYEDTQELSVEGDSHSRDGSYDQNKNHSSNSSSQSLSSAVSTPSLPVGTNTSTQQNVIFSLAGRSEQIVVEPIQPNQIQDVSYLGQQIGDYQLICQNSYGQYVLQNSRSVQIGNTGTVSLLVQDSVQPRMTVDTLNGSVQPRISRMNVDALTGSVHPRNSRMNVDALTGSVQPRMTVVTLSGSVQPRMTVDTLSGSVQPRMTVNTLNGSVQPRMTVDTLNGSVQPRMTVDTLNGSVQPRMTVDALTGSVQPRMTVDTLTGNAGELYVETENLEVPSPVHTQQEIEKQLEETAIVDTDGIKHAENEDDIITKELYLCGNCSEGFTTIQACKDHMTLVHDVTDFQTSCRVDAGTQVEPRKRLGRKRKSEMVEQEKSEQEEIVLSDTDEDWAEQLLSYSTRSRRKRKPPQALRNDYYLGRTKKKEQKKRELRDLNVDCEVPGCTSRFQDEETMKRHVECHITDAGITGPQFKCAACGEQFDNWKQTRIHMWKFHKIDIDLYSCPLCENYKTDTPSKLKIHLETHGDVRAYPCSVCGKAFKQFSQMKNHETCHLPIEIVNSKELSEKWHTPKTCDICGRRFVNIKCMKKHKEAVHAGRKDFKCTYCNYECARKAMLVLHLRTHTGEKPFKCDLCSYCCGDHNSLRRHKMRHTGQKPYRCPHCPYASIQAISLKVHVKNKHPGLGGIFCCDLCLYRTVNEKQFENHQMDHKNGLIKTEPNVKAIQMGVSKVQEEKNADAVIISSATPVLYSSFQENQNIIQVLQPQVTQNSNGQEVIETSGTQPVVQTPSLILADGQVSQLQELQMNESNEHNVVEHHSGLEPNDVAAAQLIYTALNAISENPQNEVESINSQSLLEGVESGEIQTSIETHLKEGVTTYKVTFHLSEEDEIIREITLQDQSVTSSEINMNVTDVNNWQENGSVADLEQEA